MINVTRLYCMDETPADKLRYGIGNKLKDASWRRPVVVWNITRTCNLRCIHCYSDSMAKKYGGELSTEKAKEVIDDLAEFKIPTLLFSGGEPLTRKDLFELAKYAISKNIPLTLSTNGTLITREIASKIKETGFSYVGISLDGIGESNDYFRGVKGAYEKAVEGFKNCKEVEQKVGLRLTLTKHNFDQIENIFKFVEEVGIERVCFYHLAYSGRGRNLQKEDLTHEQTIEVLDYILMKAKEYSSQRIKREILTVGNSVDGVYIYLKLLREGKTEQAEAVYKLLEWNGGALYSTGVGISCIDNIGNVHPDQFSSAIFLGNIKERKFTDIWQDDNNFILHSLRNKSKFLKGRCKECKFLMICGGGLRIRALFKYGDLWESDPACYIHNVRTSLFSSHIK